MSTASTNRASVVWNESSMHAIWASENAKCASEISSLESEASSLESQATAFDAVAAAQDVIAATAVKPEIHYRTDGSSYIVWVPDTAAIAAAKAAAAEARANAAAARAAAAARRSAASELQSVQSAMNTYITGVLRDAQAADRFFAAKLNESAAAIQAYIDKMKGLMDEIDDSVGLSGNSLAGMNANGIPGTGAGPGSGWFTNANGTPFLGAYDPITKKGMSSDGTVKQYANEWEWIYDYHGYQDKFKYKWEDHVSEQFLIREVEITKELGVSPDDLMLLMYAESGLDPASVNRNPITGNIDAVGLNQLTQIAIDEMNKSLEKPISKESLRNMTAEQQLEYVNMYFEPYSGKMNGVADLYLMNANASQTNGLGQPDNFVIYSEGKGYAGNKGLDNIGNPDLGKKGYVTKGDLSDYINMKSKDIEKR